MTLASNSTSQRPWPCPPQRPTMRMDWHELLFMHWPVDTAVLRNLIPPGIQIDTYDGQAWLSVVPFHMTGVAPRWCPDLPWMSAFPELNVRTYVTDGRRPGVWFFSLDATNPLAVRMARWLFFLPYMDARIQLRRDQGMIHYTSRRTHRGQVPAGLDVTYCGIGPQRTTAPGSLEHWLTARYIMYMADHRGQIFEGQIDHPPWSLQDAQVQVRLNSMTEGLGLDTSGPPYSAQYAAFTPVVAWKKCRLA